MSQGTTSSKSISTPMQILAIAKLEMSSYFRTVGGLLFALLMPTGLLLFATWLWYPEEAWILAVPDMFVLAILSSGLFSVGVAMTQQRVDGTLKTYLSSPLKPWAYIAGQVLDRVLVTALGAIIMVLVGTIILNIEPNGNILLFIACGVVCLATMLSFGFMLASRFTSVEVAGGSSSLLFLLVLMLSGFIIEIERFPAWLAPVIDYLPFRPIVDLMRVGWLDPDFTDGWINLGIVCAWTVLFSFIASRTFKWSANDR